MSPKNTKKSEPPCQSLHPISRILNAEANMTGSVLHPVSLEAAFEPPAHVHRVAPVPVSIGVGCPKEVPAVIQGHAPASPKGTLNDAPINSICKRLLLLFSPLDSCFLFFFSGHRYWTCLEVKLSLLDICVFFFPVDFSKWKFISPCGQVASSAPCARGACTCASRHRPAPHGWRRFRGTGATFCGVSEPKSP